MRVLKQQEQQQNYTNDEENIVIYVIQGRKINTHTQNIYVFVQFGVWFEVVPYFIH